MTQDLINAGFSLVQERKGSQRLSKRSGRYLTWWVHTDPAGHAVLTWEHELGQYVRDNDLETSVQDQLSLLLFPSGDLRGPAAADWILAEIERVEGLLRAVDLIG